jgi:hypothetical protein
MPVRETYPMHPNTMKVPKVRTNEELNEVRKKEYKYLTLFVHLPKYYRDAVKEQKRRWE